MPFFEHTYVMCDHDWALMDAVAAELRDKQPWVSVEDACHQLTPLHFERPYIWLDMPNLRVTCAWEGFRGVSPDRAVMVVRAAFESVGRPLDWAVKICAHFYPPQWSCDL